MPKRLVSLAIVIFGVLALLMAAGIATVFCFAPTSSDQFVFAMIVVIDIVATIVIWVLFKGLKASAWGSWTYNGLVVNFETAGPPAFLVIFLVVLIACWKWLPHTRSVQVQLTRADGGNLAGDFGFRLKGRRALESGDDGLATVADFPSDWDALEVVEFTHNRFAVAAQKVNGLWQFPIDSDGYVQIPVVDEYKPIARPTREEIRDLIKKSGHSDQQVADGHFTQEQKEHKVLTVASSAGREVAVWLYDCWWCFHHSNDPVDQGSEYMDIARMPDKSGEIDVKKYDEFKSTSGYFAVFLAWDDHGRPRRQFIGIHNLFDAEHRKLKISSNQGSDTPFHSTFTR